MNDWFPYRGMNVWETFKGENRDSGWEAIPLWMTDRFLQCRMKVWETFKEGNRECGWEAFFFYPPSDGAWGINDRFPHRGMNVWETFKREHRDSGRVAIPLEGARGWNMIQTNSNIHSTH